MRILTPAALLSAFAIAVAVAGPATAADYATREVGAWIVAVSSDGRGCFVTRTYPEPRGTTLQFGLDIDGSNRLTLLNPNWSIRAREQLKLDFRLSNSAFPRHVAIGIAPQGKRGFVTDFGVTFPRSFATSDYLKVRRGEVPVEELRLDGSGAAVAALRSCVDRQRTPAVGKPARDRGDRIPLDPFAGAARRDSRK
ncbi:hypothetical protein [Sphingomonas sp. 8AM]|uniref:hypothetical protein n=1 Tax=Sphingomonas sp. 8AM TaxID=2653170 RepID=UPI0012F2BA69|nr:hypothetical protein [Sphingomonas sp. 8AM]VXD01648.1 conserved exported hypothetical protein [Sphingomonas sp. 8AM]